MKKTLALPLLALALAACETPAPAPAPKPAPKPAPVASPAPAPSREAPPMTVAAPPPATEEPAATPAEPQVEQVGAMPAALPPRVNAEQIEKTFRLHQRYFSRAYRDRLRSNARLAGTVSVDFTITPEGAARDVKVTASTTNDAAFDARIAKVVEEVSFPPASGETLVTKYPLVFTPPPAKAK